MRSLVVYCQDEKEASCFYRAMGPLGLLRRQRGDFTISINPQSFNWLTSGLTDLVFFHRPCTEDHFQVINSIKRNGTPLWIDYDDAEYHLPEYHPLHSFFSNEKRNEAKKRAIAMADVVTVSTPLLKSLLEEYNPNIQVIPNAWNNALIQPQGFQNSNRTVVCWRGGTTHREDVSSVGKSILNLARKYPDVIWAFLGDSPWFRARVQNIVVKPQTDIAQYILDLYALRPTIQIVPLQKSVFNRAKSNIAWIEGTAAGAVCLAPSWGEEWQRPGIRGYEDSVDFERQLEKLIDERQAHAEMHRLSSDFLKDKLLLSDVNLLRSEILNRYFKTELY